MDLDKKISISMKGILFTLLFIAVLGSVFYAGVYWGKGPTTAAVNELEIVTEETVEEATVKQEVKEESIIQKNETTTETNKTEVSKNTTEEIITTYNNVIFTIDGIEHDYYDTWGKIKRISLTIDNKEIGTIKPEKISVAVEDYENKEDETNFIELSVGAKTIKSGQKYQGAVNYKFSYAKSVTDPENIKITVKLFDNKDKQIGLATKEFNLT